MSEKVEVVKEISETELAELENLGKEYLKAKNILDEKTKEVEKIKKRIMTIMDKSLSVKTNNYLFKAIPTVRDTLIKEAVSKKFEELKIALDSSYFKHTEYSTLKVEDLILMESKKNKASQKDLESEHRVKVSLDDLKI